MPTERTVRLECGMAVNVVCVLGTRLTVDLYSCAPLKAYEYSIKSSSGVNTEILGKNEKLRNTLSLGEILAISGKAPSQEVDDQKVSVWYYEKGSDSPKEKASFLLTFVEISLDVDADRDGVVEKNNPNKSSWKWGPKGHGAILLVNCDKEVSFSGFPDNIDNQISHDSDIEDMSRIILRTQGPLTLPERYKMVLYVSQSESDKVGVFCRCDGIFSKYQHILGRKKLFHVLKFKGKMETEFFVEGLCFPDKDFDGLISINVSFTELPDKGVPEIPLFTDKVVFRMSPWIMTPNTLEPVEAYVCCVENNDKFRKGVKNLTNEAECKLTVCYQYMNRGDRWMQDEMEFGYIEAPHKGFPVVFDSPRNRELKDFPYKKILGPDFGHVAHNTKEVNSLDSFGNLEVSPPVTVNGKHYPLGRILIGSCFPTSSGRRMANVVRDFLYAQQVQPPIELYSDWLVVGHVDEFMTFVPAKDQKGFRLLLTSPAACYKLFREKMEQGHGDAVMFEGLKTKKKKKTITEILSDKFLENFNAYVQQCIDWNRDLLKQELGLSEDDIIDIPVIFKLECKKAPYQAAAYFPDMVNMIVLCNRVGIPKPFGPIINGKCCLEEKVTSLLEPLGLECAFIDDFESYHENLGEVHCGTNVRRKPFEFKWWNMEL
ncbi:protein-arginine deiminase type-2 [Protopterus annectens]|uniref:protein-arginine deiminase type-2 n=1 Tax=Protopterus annectens TaxID=7888 RepID=UPI001CF9E55C|nr:protein-arginine deiminase type-2 [Protopterus annectens]